MRRTPWFERQFAPIADNGLLPDILERLDGTPARLAVLLATRAVTLGARPADLERSARHPRLGSPMRVIDLAYFVAEHDDHHMARLRELVTDGPDQE